MPRKQWVFDPDSGGVRIPEAVKRRVQDRIQRYAQAHFAGRYTRLEFRFRQQFCYIEAYQEPEPPSPNWPPPDWPESREEYLDRLRRTPIHLCRLRYFGQEDQWGFAFYSYANDRYELAIFPTGEFLGPPEEAFHVSAEAHLT
jgi:hypothetical protein